MTDAEKLDAISPHLDAIRAILNQTDTPETPPPMPIPDTTSHVQAATGTIRYKFRQAIFHSSRAGAAIQGILLHASEGHAAGDIPTLIGGDNRSISAHWYIQKDGSYLHMVDDSEVANHAGAVGDDRFSNRHSIGIEMERLAPEDYPSVQVKACADLCAFLMQKHGNLAIGYHKDVAVPPGRKSDPADFPRSLFETLLHDAKQINWTAEQL